MADPKCDFTCFKLPVIVFINLIQQYEKKTTLNVSRMSSNDNANCVRKFVHNFTHDVWSGLRPTDNALHNSNRK
jgi:hypothetical protein